MEKYDFNYTESERMEFAQELDDHFEFTGRKYERTKQKAIENPNSAAGMWVDMVLTIYHVYNENVTFQHDGATNSGRHSRISVSVSDKRWVMGDTEKRRELEEMGIVAFGRGTPGWFVIDYVEQERGRINRV